MAKIHYTPRIVDEEIAQALASVGAVVIEGSRGCGKTETARQQSSSELLFDLEPDIPQRLSLVPESILDGPTPRLLDEWQLAPTVWDHVRRAVDQRKQRGQFLLTGSARPADDARQHSGAGRFARIHMRPLSLWEMHRPKNYLSLAKLLNGEIADVPKPVLKFADYVESIVQGGWPGNLSSTLSQAMIANTGYIDFIVELDLASTTKQRRDPVRIQRFLHAYAQLTAQPARIQTIVDRAMAEDAGDAPSRQAIAGPYLDAIKRTMIADELPAWQPSVRSSVRLVGTPKRNFVDPSLSAAILKMGPDRLIADLEMLGFLFESLVIRDLRIYAQAMKAHCAHYRQRASRGEIDIIVEDQAHGRWAGFEVKLGSDAGMLDAAAAQLIKVAETVTTPPSALVIVTSGDYGYQRPQDGVWVIPLGSFGP